MKWVAVVVALAAWPASAGQPDYAGCIGDLQEALRAQAATGAMLDGHYRALFGNPATQAARDASAKTKAEITASLGAYIDTLAAACEALR